MITLACRIVGCLTCLFGGPRTLVIKNKIPLSLNTGAGPLAYNFGVWGPDLDLIRLKLGAPASNVFKFGG